MQPRRAITAALIVLSLSGCDAFRSEADLIAARAAEEHSRAQGIRQAEFDAMAREIAVYQGCEWGIPMCPDSITDAGRWAVSQGYAVSGATSSYFWIIIILKSLAFGAGVAAFLATLGRLYYRWVLPSAKQLSEAKEVISSAHRQSVEIIKTANANASKINEEAARTHQVLLDGAKVLLSQKKRLEADLNALRTDRETESTKLQQLQEEIKLAKAEKDLMRGFD